MGMQAVWMQRKLKLRLFTHSLENLGNLLTYLFLSIWQRYSLKNANTQMDVKMVSNQNKIKSR